MTEQSFPQARVGQTDLQVTVIGFGSASIGTLYANVAETQDIETVHFALENGIKFIDTAPFYSQLLVETRLGIALADVPRDSYVLSTKVGRPDRTDQIDFSPDGIKRSIEGSLRRLRTDRIDILHLHDVDKTTYKSALEDGYPVLESLCSQEVIKAVGVGMNCWELLMDFAHDAAFDCFILAGRYTLLEQGALSALNRFAEKKISVFGAGIYNSGILVKGAKLGAWYQYREAPVEIRNKVSRIQAVCDQYDVPLHAAAIQFVRAHAAIPSLLIGAESPLQLAQSLDGLTIAILHDFWLALQSHGLIDRAAPIPI